MYPDTFTHDNLPPAEQQAETLFELEELQFPAQLNVATEILDRQIAAGLGERTAIYAADGIWTYQHLHDTANRIAHVLVEDLGLIAGNRVLLRAANTPMLAACWLAVIKAGGVCVTTMPLLRAAELQPVVNKAEITIALVEHRLADEVHALGARTPTLSKICLFGENTDSEAEASPSLEQMLQSKPAHFDNYHSAATDVAIIAFTSGTTGMPKGTLHYHRDIMAMCVCAGRQIILAKQDDIFTGTPPLAFTFGLGILLTIPLYAGAASILTGSRTPLEMAADIQRFKATVCATAPAGYITLLNNMPDAGLPSLRKSIAGGEVLPPAVFHKWEQQTGLKMINSFGSTEMIHMFISAREEDIVPGFTGKAVPGYRVCILDDARQPVAAGTPGHLAVKGPTACKYLADERQAKYVAAGWNISGDICEMDAQGNVKYISRADDMIISSGHNISGLEVEAVLLEHEVVAECAVVGAPHEQRGMIVKAFVVLQAGVAESEALVKQLQDYAKANIAPYKYPRAIEFVAALPKTQTGKIQRNKLK